MQRELEARRTLRDSLPIYAPRCLKIRPYEGGAPVPFRFKKSQLILHERLEQQLAETGRVRAMVLKGRRMGISTYVGARFYHKATWRRGVRVYILTHEQDATDTLFDMVTRFHEHAPPSVRPELGEANAKTLAFARLDSEYHVGTAGTKGKGRGQGFHLFHGSEVGFWPHPATHFAGAVQAVSKAPGTEVILESTANGMGNEFHERWQRAEAGVGEYRAIFLPWFWEPTYRAPVPPGFVLDDDDLEYQAMWGLDLEQMVWRRDTTTELGDPLMFKQEYPATAAEAFQNTGHDSYIKPELVLRARKREGLEPIGRLVIGVDPKRFGDDRFSMAWRRGRVVEKVESDAGKIGTVEGANKVRKIIDADKPARVFIDVGGIGAGVYDILVDWGYGPEGDKGDIVRAVDFGGSPQGDAEYSDVDGKPMAGPRNRRAEMWLRSRQWLLEPGGASLPDSDKLQADACAPGYTYDMQQRLLLESKEKMRARGVRSPDEWDAVALTFAEPIGGSDNERKRPRGGPGGWQGS
jgi:hypothetical protein